MPTPIIGRPGCAITIKENGIEVLLSEAGINESVTYEIVSISPQVCDWAYEARNPLYVTPVPEVGASVGLAAGIALLAILVRLRGLRRSWSRAPECRSRGAGRTSAQAQGEPPLLPRDRTRGR